MGKKDPRIDAYIAKSADFARPILAHLRELVHSACPEVEETLKWGFPHFMYDGILCSMAAFKQHCAFGFWNREVGAAAKAGTKSGEAMGQFGRITGPADLPKDSVVVRLIKEAVRLKDAGVKPRPQARPKKKAALRVPGYFLAALKKNKKALAAFEKFNYSQKKEYVEWLTEARQEETRNKRLQTALEWISEGKVRNWKYLKK